MHVAGTAAATIVTLALTSPAAAQTRLTAGPGTNRHPVWNPTGTHLAFESDRAGNWDLYLLEPASGTVTRITTQASNERYPAWSPDGGRLAFASDRDGAWDLFTVDLESGAQELLAQLPGEEAFLDWSPDGREIAFSRRIEETIEIALLRIGDATARLLATGPFRHVWPRWSPAGDRISLFSRRDTAGEDDEIYLLDPTSGNLTRVTERPGHDCCQDWSPSGDRLVVVAVDPDGSRRLAIIDLDGTELARLAEGFHRVTEPAWSPTGRAIAYAARRSPDHPYQIYIEPPP